MLRRTLAVLLASALCLVYVTPLHAWNDRGHMLVAFIAFRHLNPAAKKEVGRLLKLNPQYSSWIKGVPASATAERRALVAFVHAATWPDFIKGLPKYISDGPDDGNTPPDGPGASQNVGYGDLNRHKYWHFINIPFSDDGTPTHNPPDVNARSEIELMRKALGSSGTLDDVKSYDLVWLAHLVGDVHQPLHSTARFTHADTDGDKGGNDVKLSCVAWLQCKANLHSQWDGLFGNSLAQNSIFSTGANLDNGPAPPGAKSTDVGEWIQESVDLAKTTAYQSTTGTPLGDPNAAITLAYVQRARSSARQRVVLAGRRLAVLVNEALGKQ